MSEDKKEAIKCLVEKSSEEQSTEILLNSVSQKIKTDKNENSFLYIYRKNENIVSKINKKLAEINPIALIRSQKTGSQSDV